ncbi:MAG: bifunctional oligoribonuclease/PAP phosphatase NrnA [Gemmatimonadota bacterium]|nr:MAG: bifunctional oligoribonuclease/PAP phosphatase NrnA [Gemmatimonadota bacterium]
MTYRTPEDRLEAIGSVLAALEGKKRAILTTHLNADGDGAGSQVALGSWLRGRGIEAWIVNPTPFPDRYRFLLDDPSWIANAAGPESAKLCEEADVAVVLDTGEKHRIGRTRPLIKKLPTIVIDHHPEGDGPIDGVVFRAVDASATGEMVFDILSVAGGPWSEEAVRGMYVAILTDTGGFRFSNATALCHHVVGELIQKGVEPDLMHREVFGDVPLRRFQLLRHTLANLEVDDDSGVAWVTVPAKEYKELGAVPDDLENIVDYPRSIRGVKVALLFRETKANTTKVSFRSNGPVDVNALAHRFGGGGHARAAGALVVGSLESVRAEVVEATRQAVGTTGPPTGTDSQE